MNQCLESLKQYLAQNGCCGFVILILNLPLACLANPRATLLESISSSPYFYLRDYSGAYL